MVIMSLTTKMVRFMKKENTLMESETEDGLNMKEMEINQTLIYIERENV